MKMINWQNKGKRINSTLLKEIRNITTRKLMKVKIRN